MASSSTPTENDTSPGLSLDTTRALATQALALTVQEWSSLGQGDDPLVADDALWNDDVVDEKSCFDQCVERVVSLMVVRVAAIGLYAVEGTHKDLSTSGICRQALMADEAPWPFITERILEQLTRFVRSTLQEYSSTLPFHNLRHAVTVTVSCNKLLDLMLSGDSHQHYGGFRPTTFGLRTDPTLMLSLIFAALIHDVRHQGVRNTQLVVENYPAALLYNDQSVQEKQSLQVAFAELLKPDYDVLRQTLFGRDDAAYRYFRMTVISAVMSTDLASPEQTVLTKSKWKEAFDQYTSPQQQHQPNAGRRGSLLSNISMPRTLGMGRINRRGSNVSEMSDVTMQSTFSPQRVSRRASYSGDVGGEGGTYSIPRRFSVDHARRRMSGDSNYGRRRLSLEHNDRRRMSADGFDSPVAASSRRRQRPQRQSGNNSGFDDVNDFAIDSLDILMDSGYAPRNGATDESINSLVSDTIDSFAVMKHKQKPLRDGVSEEKTNGQRRGSMGNAPARREMMRSLSGETSESANEASASLVSFAAESIGMNQKRLDGAKLTRPRTNKPLGDFPNDDSTPHKPISNQQQYSEAGRDTTAHDEESSFSLTPPSSEEEFDGPSIPNSIVHRQGAVKQSRTADAQETPLKTKHVTRRASTGMVSSRFGSLTDERIDEDRPNHATYRDVQGNSGETIPTMDSSRFRKRLGILRSMDLSGESIEIFSRQGSMGAVSMLSNPWGGAGEGGQTDEEPDYLRASTVIETLLRAADVGHFLQSWENMTSWSSRMFLELAQAHDVGRGHDPGPSWFDNQIRIIDSYLKPLALQLDDSGVFGDYVGASFAQNVDEIRSRWLVSGFEWTEAMREEVATKLSK